MPRRPERALNVPAIDFPASTIMSQGRPTVEKKAAKAVKAVTSALIDPFMKSANEKLVM